MANFNPNPIPPEELNRDTRRKNRILFMMAMAQNPRHFYCCGIGVTVEFDDGGPALQDKLAGFLIRQKSGL